MVIRKGQKMAYENDVLTRNEDSELAVRVVTATEGTNNSSYDDVFTRDSNGKLAVRVVGAGGGDSHNLGFYATQEALEEAYPTAEEGDYAIVGSTDTVWVWDTDNSEWVDTGTKGLVQSVNGQTGTVVLSAADVGAIPQLSTMPTASASNVGNIVQFKGTTTGTYTNGYFYKSVAGEQSIGSGTATVTDFDGGDDEQDLPAPTFTFNVNTFNTFATNLGYGEITDTTLEIDIADNESNFLIEVHYNNGDESFTTQTASQSMSDLESTLASFGVSVDLTGFTWVTVAYLDLPTSTSYSWERVDIQPAPDPLPSQTGHSGEFLMTNGTAASWSDKPLVNTATGNNSLTILGTPTSSQNATNIGVGAAVSSFSGTALGRSASCSGSRGLAVGNGASARGERAIQLGYGDNANNDTFKVANNNGNFEIMSADGTMPSDRLVHAINKYSSMPTAASTNEGWIVQFTGTTDATYTHGYIYECVSDGGNPATYSWSAINVQPAGSGQNSYSANIEFDPNQNDDYGIITITGVAGKSSTLYIRQNVSYEEGGVWSDPEYNAEFIGILQPTNDETGYGSSKLIQINRTQDIYVAAYGSQTANGEPVLEIEYSFNNSVWKDDHCKFILDISTDDTLTITTSKNTSAVGEPGAGTMTVPNPLFDESDSYEYYLTTQNGSMSWALVQNTSPLPSQTGNSGKFLTTDGTDASWSDTVGGELSVKKTASSSFMGVDCIKLYAVYNGNEGTPFKIGTTNGGFGVFSGNAYMQGNIFPSDGFKNLGSNLYVWQKVYAQKICNTQEITVPNTAGTMAVQVSALPTADSTRVGQIYQYIGATNANYTHGYYYECVSDGGNPATYSWSAINVQAGGGGGGSTAATATLADSGWSSNSQTVNVTGVTANNNVIVAAAPASQADYSACGIICTAQGAGTLTFTCDSVPTTGITVNVLII